MNKLFAALTKLQEAAFITLLFLFPTQLGLHFWPQWAHVFGIRVDYLAPTLYLTDVLIIIVGVLWLGERLLLKRRLRIGTIAALAIFGLFVFALTNSYFSPNRFAAIYKWVKVAELGFVAFLITQQSGRILRRGLVALFVSTVAFSVVGIVQFFNQSSLRGILYYFGERNIGPQTPGAALVSLGGGEFLRAYSVFSHPNSFAGFMVATLPIFFATFTKHGRQFWLAALIIFAGILFTFSRSAFAALGIIVLLATAKNFLTISKLARPLILITVLIGLVMPFLAKWSNEGSRSVAERLVLAKGAGELFAQSPIVGVGLNNFIVRSQEVVGNIPQVWQLQPVHNIFLLALSETGLVGLLLVAFLFWQTARRYNMWVGLAIIAILLTGVVDHYWFTLQQNQLLFSLVVGLSLRKDLNNGKD